MLVLRNTVSRMYTSCPMKNSCFGQLLLRSCDLNTHVEKVQNLVKGQFGQMLTKATCSFPVLEADQSCEESMNMSIKQLIHVTIRYPPMGAPTNEGTHQ